MSVLHVHMEKNDSSSVQRTLSLIQDTASGDLETSLKVAHDAIHVLNERLASLSGLHERVASLEAENAELTKSLTHEHVKREDTHVADVVTADEKDVANLYSFCVEGLLDSESLLSSVTRILATFILIFVQVIYAYGYMDASIILAVVGDMPGFADPVDNSLFYSDTMFPGIRVPVCQVLASACSIMLLSLVLKQDNEGTLCTSNPLVELVLLPWQARWHVGGQEGAVTGSNHNTTSEPQPHSRVRHAVVCILLMVPYYCRALLIPIYAATGVRARTENHRTIAYCSFRGLFRLGVCRASQAAGNFAGAANAQEIVLNSVR
jgi:hypothetical protein